MSLKMAHLVFVTALTALSFATGGIELKAYLGPDKAPGDLAFSIGGFAAGIVVIIYGRYVLKKLKNVSYL